MYASRVEEDASQEKVFLQVFIYLHQELGMFSHLHWDKTSLILLSYRNYLWFMGMAEEENWDQSLALPQ